MSRARKLSAPSESPALFQTAMRNISRLISERSGIFLTPQKTFLIETRLQRRLDELGLQTFHQYAQYLEENPKELSVCIECITTHKTEWFREIVHFQWLKSELPKLIGPGKTLKIWSAACSSGEEVFSILFFLLRNGLNHTQFRILGSDISRPILKKAMMLPSRREFALQKEMLLRHTSDRGRVELELKLALESSIKFRNLNLIDNTTLLPVKFDVIFLRNVLIYFERPVVLEVCRHLVRHLNPGGYLILGLSESLHRELPELVYVGNSIYRYQPRGFK